VRGRPVAALVPISGVDFESLSLSTNPDFISLIERSRATLLTDGGIPAPEARRRLGLHPAPRQRRTRRKK
jgi:hypothetical protein